MTRKSHFCERDEQAAIAFVVVSQQFVGSHQFLHRIEETFQLLCVVDVSGFVPQLLVHLRQCGSAKTVLTVAQINQHQRRFTFVGTKLRRYGLTYVFNTAKRSDNQR